MMLDRVVDFITDRDMQASGEVRISMLAYLKGLDTHLESGYTPTKEVQRRLDDLERACKEFEESLVSEGIFNGADEIMSDKLIPDEDDIPDDDTPGENIEDEEDEEDEQENDDFPSVDDEEDDVTSDDDLDDDDDDQA